MKLASVNLGVLRGGDWAGSLRSTGIDKRPADGRVRVGRLGVEGDMIVDMQNHGGLDQAVYAYAAEDAAWWSAELDRPVGPGAFGENLTTVGLDVNGALIGERWAIGGAVVEVCSVRIPCRTFAGFWDVPDLVKRFTQRAVPGAYLRVVEEGEVGAGDAIEVVSRPEGHDVTVGEMFRALTTEPELLPRLLAVPAIPEPTREKVARRVG